MRANTASRSKSKKWVKYQYIEESVVRFALDLIGPHRAIKHHKTKIDKIKWLIWSQTGSMSIVYGQPNGEGSMWPDVSILCGVESWKPSSPFISLLCPSSFRISTLLFCALNYYWSAFSNILNWRVLRVGLNSEMDFQELVEPLLIYFKFFLMTALALLELD